MYSASNLAKNSGKDLTTSGFVANTAGEALSGALGGAAGATLLGGTVGELLKVCLIDIIEI